MKDPCQCHVAVVNSRRVLPYFYDCPHPIGSPLKFACSVPEENGLINGRMWISVTSALRLPATALVACFVAAYWHTLGNAFIPALELINTICPLRVISMGNKACVKAKGARTLMRYYLSNASRGADSILPHVIVPAQWRGRCTCPQSLFTRSGVPRKPSCAVRS